MRHEPKRTLHVTAGPHSGFFADISAPVRSGHIDPRPRNVSFQRARRPHRRFETHVPSVPRRQQ